MTIRSSCPTPIATTNLSLASGAASPRSPFALVDLQHRHVEYLRVSVTDRCNFRCTYCMPSEGVEWLARDELLTFDEIETLVRQFVALGVRKLRLTGGEPLLRRGVVELVQRLAGIPELVDVAMTTNGHLLEELALPLRQAGLHRLNVSLDTLDSRQFATLTRKGSLQSVLRGLDAADQAGFRHTKINAVMLRGLSEPSLSELAEFCSDRDYILRCIEYMPIGTDEHWGPETWLPIANVRELLSLQWELTPDPQRQEPGGGPAVRWLAQHRQRPGRILKLGLIAAVSEKFCRDCNRVRLSSTGMLRECLSTQGALSLRDLLRAGASPEVVRQAMTAALQGKVDAHRFDAAQTTREAMSTIGG